MISVGCPAEDTFTPAGCMAAGVLQEGRDLEDGDNAVDASDAPLLRGFIHSLVKEGSTDRRSTAIEVSGCNSLLVETKVFSLGGGQTTLSFGLS